MTARTTGSLSGYLPSIIIGAAFFIALVTGVLLFSKHRAHPRTMTAAGPPGAQPPNIRGDPDARIMLEEFGDFECMPCFLLWPAMRNLEQEFGDQLAVTFREHPLPQHTRALEAARAAEAAGLQGRFWQMHDILYLNRGAWVRAAQPRSVFAKFAGRLGIDVNRFSRDMDGAEVAKRMTADQARGSALAIDRTPIVYVNGGAVDFSADPEKALRAAVMEAKTKTPTRN